MSPHNYLKIFNKCVLMLGLLNSFLCSTLESSICIEKNVFMYMNSFAP